MWDVELTREAVKGAKKLPQKEQELLKLLVENIKLEGPVQHRWKNYSKLGMHTYHCHLSYRWVACWRVDKDEVKLIKIYYAGSRENAPY